MPPTRPNGPGLNKQFLRVLIPLFFLLLGCQLSENVSLPTLVPTAFFANLAPISTSEPVPPTYTVGAQPILAESGFSTRPVTSTPLPTPSPRPSPTIVINDGKYPQTINAPYQDTPASLVECNGQGAIFRSRFPSDVAGPWRSYHAYLPPCYGQDGRTYPVIYRLRPPLE